ncbi:MAG: LysR family transcriptional regulator [Mesorhizobium sp.]|uniref:LysR family transcriptional regulator n=1 Tax=unclassified Mesorhizobium TaxID=325217 RepID=UPI000FD366E4|nr:MULTISPECIES: LysR family transcriptional regulator [unclassified Mesorhizobium]RUV96790.1 LysR family transcriptional regulator [Mesorhizobium sp. M5C.F.Ca.IN.020.14.1.1]RUV32747.1 LysR family transcriptional regulator [Mesorhizobium sp. M5C.F.Ca.IN.020.32.2.1]RWC29903.1 MAG: LysR family transcriptional regulator [Mesorhizobium sp.]RWD48983.1 MAG: LysR family transcriptional regulator [Mesorhizobium sp.]RWE10215.1 MAG: LysR family transcriptional regulator [Mesorhizobium sp.]
MARPGLHDLEAVVAVARRSSFRGAALELGMSTTALSNAVGKLEAHLGVRLFNRTTRSVSLSDAGRLFVENVGPALQDIHGAMDAARSKQANPTGTLRINSYATAAREILSPLLLEFIKRYPQVHIDLVTEGRLLDIVAEGFDLGVRRAALVPSDMIAISLGRPQRNVVIGSPDYFKSYGTPSTPTDLLQHRCIRIRLPNGALFRWRFEKDGEPLLIDVNGPMTLDEASLSRGTVLEGVALGYVMERDVREDIEAGRLISVLKEWLPPSDELCIYYPGRRNPSAAHRAFVELARELGSKGRNTAV